MNTKTIIPGLFSFVVALTVAQSAQAQLQVAQSLPQSMTESMVSPIQAPSARHPANDQQGTIELQEQVLAQINDGLSNDWLSVQQATKLKSEVDALNTQETWYKSLREQIPALLIEKNTTTLQAMKSTLQPKTHASASAQNALHTDISETINKALAQNQITSGDAESYYLRLAQIESNLEGSKRNPHGSADEAVMNKSIQQIKAELKLKVRAN